MQTDLVDLFQTIDKVTIELSLGEPPYLLINSYMVPLALVKPLISILQTSPKHKTFLDQLMPKITQLELLHRKWYALKYSLETLEHAQHSTKIAALEYEQSWKQLHE